MPSWCLSQKGMVLTMNKSIGMIDKSFSKYSITNIYGANIAEQEFIKKLSQYSNFDELCFINFKGYYNDLIVNRQSLKKDNNPNMKIKALNKFNVLQNQEDANISILHDTFGDFVKLILFRDLYTKAKPPITYIMHCTSASDYPFDTYLLQYLLQFQEYDSLICTSSAMKEVVKFYLNNLSEKFNEIYGINLRYNGRLDTIPLGVDIEKYKVLDKEICRKKLNIPQDAFVILYHGRINFYFKADLFPLIKVFKRLTLQNKDKKIVLVISGEDSPEVPYYLYIKKYISELELEDKVILIDYNTNDNTSIYGAADVFTSPIDNVQETFGLTVIEAMACGIPQVVSDWDGYKETVKHGETGFLIKTYWANCGNDISSFPVVDRHGELGHKVFYSHYLLSQSLAIDLEEYQKAFQVLLDNPILLKSMSEKSVKRAYEKFKWETVINSYDNLWSELIAIKNKCEYITNKALCLFNNNYSEAFFNYPTYFVNNEDKLYINEDGINFIKLDKSFPLHFKNEIYFLEYNLSKKILNFIYNYREKKITLTDIINNYTPEFNIDIIKRCIMFLIKHGYISLNMHIK